MKKIITILAAVTLLAMESVYSQAPQRFKYQAIARDNSGNVLANQNVSFRISILLGSASGTSVYTETQTASTNQFGLANLNIGSGTLVSGNFSIINWANNSYYVKIEFDPAGGSSYTTMGTSQLLSVPYSLYAEKSGSSLTDHDTSATNELQTLSQTGANVTLSKGGGTISLADGDTAIWKKTGNNLYYNSGYVGIGTNSPGYKLDVTGGNVNIESPGPFIKLKETGNNDVAGIYFQASGYGNSNQLRFTVGGTNVDPTSQTQAMVIDQSGNVGIGNTNPSSALSVGPSSQFQVNSTGNITQINNVTTSFPSSQGTAATFLRNDGSGNLTWAAATPAGWGLTGNSGTTAGTNFIGTTDATDWVVKTNSVEKMRVMSGGNIGIGTTSPATKLHIVGDAVSVDLLKLQNTNTTYPRSYRIGPGAGIAAGFGIYDDNASAARLAIDFNGNTGIGTATPASKLDVEGGISIGATYSGTTAAPTNGAIIEGNVGIGNSAPGYKLDILGGNINIDHPGPFIKFKETGNNDVAGIYFQASGYGNANQLRFTVSSSNLDPSSQTQAMVIDQSGSVGIATTNPQSKLQVKGGDVYVEDVSKGIIIKSPNGSCWRITVDNSGGFVSQSISCP